MSRRVITTEKKPQAGKRRLRLVDPFALTLSLLVFLATAALAVVSAQTGFQKHWYGDVLTMLDWIVGILALVNLLCTLSVGVRITDGVADIGRNAGGGRNTFDAALLREITVADGNGERLSEDQRRWRNASLKFHLTDGTTRLSRPAAILTAHQLRSVRHFFGLQ